jgi:hypothetical protein
MPVPRGTMHRLQRVSTRDSGLTAFYPFGGSVLRATHGENRLVPLVPGEDILADEVTDGAEVVGQVFSNQAGESLTRCFNSSRAVSFFELWKR